MHVARKLTLPASWLTFADAIAEGYSVPDASAKAGFSARNGSETIKDTRLRALVQEKLQTKLVSVAAPVSFRVALELLLDPATPARVRADIAFRLMDRAGLAPPSKAAAGKGEGAKSLSELGAEDLRALIGTLETELSDRARPVIHATIATPPPQLADMLE